MRVIGQPMVYNTLIYLLAIITFGLISFILLGTCFNLCNGRKYGL